MTRSGHRGLNESVPENIPRTLVQARSLAQSKSNVEANDQTRECSRTSTADGSHWSLESACERVANVIKQGEQLLARKSRRADAHDRDQRANQAILDRGYTGIVSDETSEKLCHRYNRERGGTLRQAARQPWQRCRKARLRRGADASLFI